MYVGLTRQGVEDRYGKNGTGYKGFYFYNAIQKYGWGGFEHETIASGLAKKEGCNFEMLLIDKLNTTNQDYGYNISKGGNSTTTGMERPELSKRNLEGSKAILQYDFNGNLVREYSSLREMSRETGYQRASVSKNCKGKTQHAYYYLWTYKDDINMLDCLLKNIKLNKIYETHINVNQYDIHGNFICAYKSIRNASANSSISQKHIKGSCEGKIYNNDAYIFKHRREEVIK